MLADLGDLGDLLVGFLAAVGTLTIQIFTFLWSLVTFDLGPSLGLGHLPVWTLLLGAAGCFAFLVGLVWFMERSVSERINIVMAFATVVGIGLGMWQWRSQVDREESRRHVEFVNRIAVLTYDAPQGLRVTVRNANPAMADVVFLSLARASHAPENWEIHVEPCTERSFIVSPRATWQSIVRKGGRDWATGADPTEIPLTSLMGVYGIKDANGASQLLIGGVGGASERSSVSDCA